MLHLQGDPALQSKTMDELQQRFVELAPQAADMLEQLGDLHSKLAPIPRAPRGPQGCTPEAVRARAMARRRQTLGIDREVVRYRLSKQEREAVRAQIQALLPQYTAISDERNAIAREIDVRKRRASIKNRASAIPKDEADALIEVLREIA